MKKTSASHGFWSRGPAEHLKVLQARRDEELESLQAQLDATKDAGEVARLEDAISKVHGSYAEKKDKVANDLF